MKRQSMTDRYLCVPVKFGGLTMPRYQMIRELQETARVNFPDNPARQTACVNMYLAGHARFEPTEPGVVPLAKNQGREPPLG